jgi:O-antigen ligase
MTGQAVLGASPRSSLKAWPRSDANVLWISGIGLLVTAVTFAHVRNPQVGFDKFALPKELSFQVLTLIACGKLLIDRNAQYAISRSWARWPSLFLSAFVAWSFISWLAAATNSWEASRAVGLAASMLMLWLLVGASGDRDMLTVVGITVAILSCASIASILDALGFLPGLSLPHRGPGGVFGNRNYASHVFVLMLPACWYLYRRAGRTWQVVYISLATALVVAPIVFGRSRGAWLGAVAALISGAVAAVSVARTRRDQPRARTQLLRRAVFVLGVVCGLLGGQLIATRIWESTAAPLAETASHIVDATAGSGHDRLVQYSTTLQIIRDHPILGVGPGNWSVAYAHYASGDDRSYDRDGIDPLNRFASSDLLDLAAERGVVGVVLLLAALAAAWLLTLRATEFRSARKVAPGYPTANSPIETAGSNISRIAKERVPETRDKFVALTALFGGYIVMAMIDSLLVQAPAAVIISIFAGAWTENGVRGFDRTHSRYKSVPRILLSLSIALLLVSTTRIVRSLFVVIAYSSSASLEDLNTLTALAPGDYALHVIVARHAAKVGNCGLMRDQIRRADALFPFRPLAPLLGHSCSRVPPPDSHPGR